jgi:hypothetical protein
MPGFGTTRSTPRNSSLAAAPERYLNLEAVAFVPLIIAPQLGETLPPKQSCPLSFCGFSRMETRGPQQILVEKSGHLNNAQGCPNNLIKENWEEEYVEEIRRSATLDYSVRRRRPCHNTP